MSIRALNQKSSVALVKEVFATAQVAGKLRHSAALDLLARLAGYQSWAHQKMTSRAGAVPPLGAVTAISLVSDFLTEESEAAQTWQEKWASEASAGETRRGLVDYILAKLEEEHGLSLLESTFQAARADVTQLDGTQTRWCFENNLTDRWGDFNLAFHETKPSLMPLLLDESKLQALRDCMWSETTFVAAKDGVLGVLYEVEYCSIESDADEEEPDELKPYAEVKAALLKGMKRLKAQYPQGEFVVPHEDEVCNGRPAAWAFFKLEDAHALTDKQRDSLSADLYNL